MDYRPVDLDDALENDLRQLVRLAIAEDLDVAMDWTTVTMIPQGRRGACAIVPRQVGIAAGIALTTWIIDEFDADLKATLLIEDGQTLTRGQPIVRLEGAARDLLTSERVLLNILSRMCGVATLTSRFVAAMGDHAARLYDTRKTTPGWRRLEKYAVRCGGGHNHRTGLYDGFLIKDNHLALGRSERDGDPDAALSAGEAAIRAVKMRGSGVNHLTAPNIVEIEVDTIDQLHQVLDTGIDIVLLDNFSTAQLVQAVALRDRIAPSVELEASGNVTLATIATVAATGVDRISSGALTHQATWLDLGMDWSGADAS